MTTNPGTASKKVTLFAFALAVLGLVAESLALFDLSSIDSSQLLIPIRGITTSLNLNFFNLSLINYYNFDSGLYLNYLNAIFYFLLLIGAIFYLVSKGRETRLVRFVLSIVFISNVSFVLWEIANLHSYLNYFTAAEGKNLWLFWVLEFISDASLGYAAYRVLNYFRQNKALEAEHTDVDGQQFYVVGEASGWQRFTHLLLDSFICLVIFSQFAPAVGPSFFKSIEASAGRDTALYVFLLISRLVYYPFFEIILGATPPNCLPKRG